MTSTTSCPYPYCLKEDGHEGRHTLTERMNNCKHERMTVFIINIHSVGFCPECKTTFFDGIYSEQLTELFTLGDKGN